MLGEHTQGKQRITPLPSRVRHTRSLYLLTIGTQAATEATTPAGDPPPTRTPKWISSWTRAACLPAVRVQPPRWRSMPQAPNMDEPFKIVIAGAKHTHVHDAPNTPSLMVMISIKRFHIPFISCQPHCDRCIKNTSTPAPNNTARVAP